MADEAVRLVLWTADSRFDKYTAKTVIFECLWALNTIFAKAGSCFDERWAHAVAQKWFVLNHVKHGPTWAQRLTWFDFEA